MSSAEGQVSWDKLDQPTFDRFVEALVLRVELAADPKVEVDPIDGRGGDGGRDIDVRENGRLTHIYQLKYFPEGFSGAWGKSRKRQISKSFEDAMQHDPTAWTLVVPRNPTPGELDFVRSLKKGHKVTIRIMGRAKLDEQMARFPDLLHWATREPLVETLRMLKLEGSALVGASDLQEAVENLQEAADARNPNWTVNHSYENGVYTETVVAKHALAQQVEPIGLRSARIEIPANETELGEQATRVFRYGDNEELTLTGDYLKDVDFVAPEWSSLSKTMESPVLKILPKPSLKDDLELELQIVDEQDVVIRSYAGKCSYLGRGTEGGTIKARVAGGIDLRMTFDLVDYEKEPDRQPGGGITFSQDNAGLSATEAKLGLRFIEDMAVPHKVRVLTNGEFAYSFMSGEGLSRPPEDVEDRLDGDWALIVDDLAVLEKELGIQFLIPKELTNYERIVIRVARLLLEGQVVLHPFIGQLEGTLRDDLSPDMLALIRDGGGAVFADLRQLTIDILGKKVALGRARLAIVDAEIFNADTLIEAIDAGRTEELAFAARVRGNQGVKIFLPGRIEQGASELTVTPWGVPGIPEHNELRGISAPPALPEPQEPAPSDA